MIQLLAIGFYFLLALGVGLLSYRKQTSSADFLIGNRSLNYWLTALAAHASDMSNWLFMGYPAIIFIGGLFNAWVAIGLTLCMLLNWQWIAPKLRVLTEKSGDLTLSGFFESKLGDRSGLIRLFSAGICLLFYSIYIAAGLVGLGHLAESLFGISYQLGILFGIVIVITYVL
ncbi:MAG: sodium/proline symporter, partial [Simkania sp.]|nr:sodium/proline symporter [Simkania sp.]